ncbi:hypothetical protein [Hydrocarboniclastica marina]|uniref:Uncharacterized protein n=1 Tax=Hydrocarboniclastica marina TaxID=2259620 RepID=A0A4P7XLT3_9ALTE|nr:hypothetical protein [Hydrocarboniclastica marina]QCF28141.1 hypothetical protein soil367_18900 [Hydrocarboniclastica marina]
MNILEVASTAILGAALGAGVTFFLVNDRITALEQESQLRAPVATVDFTSIAEGFPNGADNQAIDREIKKLQVQANQLMEQGFIVLNHGSVYAAPSGLTVRYREKDGE